MSKLFSTSNDSLKDTGILILRLMLGTVMFAHGAQKVFGIWGGKGLDETVQMMGGMVGTIPAYLSIFTEFLGGIALIFGVVTRFWGIGIVINMAVAVLMVHLKNGFIGQGGFEYPLTLLMVALAITLIGPGAYSVDAAMFRAPSVRLRDALRTGKPLTGRPA